MPLREYQSLCEERAAQIVSRDRGNTQYHKGINKKGYAVSHYQIDDVVIKEGERCDFLLMNEDKRRAYLIELKGQDIVKAARQLEATEDTLRHEMKAYEVFYRIVANKCRTQAIRSSDFRKYQIRWKGRLVMKTGFIEEDI